MNELEKIKRLRQIFSLHACHLIMPRSTAYELFLTCLASIFKVNDDIVEYGPFTGETSFYLNNLLDQDEKFIGVDNFSQSSAIYDVKQMMKDKIKLHLNLTTLHSNFEIIEKDAIADPYVADAGFIFWDICYGAGSAEALLSLMENCCTTQTIIVVDDASQLVHSANLDFRAKWHQYITNNQVPFRPFLSTYNRIFYSNYDIDMKFKLIIILLINNQYLINYKNQEMFERLPKCNIVSCKEHIPSAATRDIGGHDFLNNDPIWDSMFEIIQGKSS